MPNVRNLKYNNTIVEQPVVNNYKLRKWVHEGVVVWENQWEGSIWGLKQYAASGVAGYCIEKFNFAEGRDGQGSYFELYHEAEDVGMACIKNNGQYAMRLRYNNSKWYFSSTNKCPDNGGSWSTEVELEGTRLHTTLYGAQATKYGLIYCVIDNNNTDYYTYYFYHKHQTENIDELIYTWESHISSAGGYESYTPLIREIQRVSVDTTQNRVRSMYDFTDGNICLDGFVIRSEWSGNTADIVDLNFEFCEYVTGTRNGTTTFVSVSLHPIIQNANTYMPYYGCSRYSDPFAYTSLVTASCTYNGSVQIRYNKYVATIGQWSYWMDFLVTYNYENDTRNGVVVTPDYNQAAFTYNGECFSIESFLNYQHTQYPDVEDYARWYASFVEQNPMVGELYYEIVRAFNSKYTQIYCKFGRIEKSGTVEFGSNNFREYQGTFAKVCDDSVEKNSYNRPPLDRPIEQEHNVYICDNTVDRQPGDTTAYDRSMRWDINQNLGTNEVIWDSDGNIIDPFEKYKNTTTGKYPFGILTYYTVDGLYSMIVCVPGEPRTGITAPDRSIFYFRVNTMGDLNSKLIHKFYR